MFLITQDRETAIRMSEIEQISFCDVSTNDEDGEKEIYELVVYTKTKKRSQLIGRFFDFFEAKEEINRIFKAIEKNKKTVVRIGKVM